MPRVDFYILNDRSPGTRALFACRLTEKAYGLGHRVYIHTCNPEQARMVDDLLWTFRPGSFVPHDLHPTEPDCPVVIGCNTPPQGMALLINLDLKVPAFHGQFDRVAELVDQDPEGLARGRERFKVYKSQGIEPQTHRL